MRLVQVRLSECRRLAEGAVGADSFMDVEVEEPIECKCRRCEPNTARQTTI